MIYDSEDGRHESDSLSARSACSRQARQCLRVPSRRRCRRRSPESVTSALSPTTFRLADHNLRRKNAPALLTRNCCVYSLLFLHGGLDTSSVVTCAFCSSIVLNTAASTMNLVAVRLTERSRSNISVFAEALLFLHCCSATTPAALHRAWAS